MLCLDLHLKTLPSKALVSVYRLVGELINFRQRRGVLCSSSKSLSFRRKPAIHQQKHSLNIFQLFLTFALPVSKLSCSWLTSVNTRWEFFRLTRTLNHREERRLHAQTRASVDKCEPEWKPQIWYPKTGLLWEPPRISCPWLKSKRVVRLKTDDSQLLPSVSFLKLFQTDETLLVQQPR